MVRGPVRHFSSSFAPLDTTRRDETRSNLCRPLCCECAFYSHAAWQEEERQRGRICQNEEPRTRERIRSAPHFAHTRIPPCRKKNSKAIALPEMKNRAPEKGFAPHPISPQKIREWTTHGTHKAGLTSSASRRRCSAAEVPLASPTQEMSANEHRRCDITSRENPDAHNLHRDMIMSQRTDGSASIPSGDSN